MTPAQRASSVARRAEIWGKLHPEENRQRVADLDESAPGGSSCATRSNGGHFAKGNDGGGKAFAADTAKVSGQSKSDINRHLARGRALARLRAHRRRNLHQHHHHEGSRP